MEKKESLQYSFYTGVKLGKQRAGRSFFDDRRRISIQMLLDSLQLRHCLSEPP